MWDGNSTCNYSAVIFATNGLGGQLSDSDASRIVNFEVACSAREAVLYAWPSADLGLAYDAPAGYDPNAPFNAHVADATFFSRVKASAPIPYADAWGYPAKVIDANTTSLVQDANNKTILALHKTADGREVLVSTFDSNQYMPHSFILEYDMLRWLTRGTFVGKKRTYLSAQIDDIFLDNFMWNSDLNTTVEDETSSAARTFRISGPDMTSFVAWQTGLRNRLPAGSSFITEMAFNGAGTTTSGDPLVSAARNAGSKLTWLNHTWDHENMDAMLRGDAKTEVQKNCRRASNLGLSGFKCIELITPDMSGLTNQGAILGMLDAGARYVVSDTSHDPNAYGITDAQKADFTAHPGTNPSFNVGRPNWIDARLYHVPRHPTSVFYNVEETNGYVDEYNYLYASYWGRELTYPEVVDKASDFGFIYLLQGDIDPMMFHQANLHNYGGGHSLYGDFVDAVVNKYLAVSSMPILSVSQDAIAVAMQDRDRLNKCGVTATIVESATGRGLELKSTGSCTVPVTGVNNPLYGKVETYGTEKTTLVSLSAGVAKTIPLPL